MPSDPSLDRLFGAIARALDGLVAGDLAQRKQLGELLKNVASLQKYVELSSRRTDGRLTQLQVSLGALVEQVEQLVEHQKTVYGAALDVKRVVNDSQQKVGTALEEWKEETGKHFVYKEKLEELENREEISAQWIRVRPITIIKHVVKYSKIYGPIAAKIAGLTIAIGASIYQFITSMDILGWHW